MPDHAFRAFCANASLARASTTRGKTNERVAVQIFTRRILIRFRARLFVHPRRRTDYFFPPPAPLRRFAETVVTNRRVFVRFRADFARLSSFRCSSNSGRQLFSKPAAQFTVNPRGPLPATRTRNSDQSLIAPLS